MFERRLANHFERAGWQMEPSTLFESPSSQIAPDWLMKRGPSRRAVWVRDEPPGAWEIGTWAHSCRQQDLGGILICPYDSAALELCEQMGLEFLPLESLEEIPITPMASLPTTSVAVETKPLPKLTLPKRSVQHPTIPWWRWAIVALIWVLAVGVLAYDWIRWMKG